MAGQVNKRMLYVGGIADEVDVQVRPRPRILLACDSDSKLGTTQSSVRQRSSSNTLTTNPPTTLTPVGGSQTVRAAFIPFGDLAEVQVSLLPD